MVCEMKRWIVRDDARGSLFVGLTPSSVAIFTSDHYLLLTNAIDRVSSFDTEEEAHDFIEMCFEESDAADLTVHPVESKDRFITNIELVKAGFEREAAPLLIPAPTLTNTLH